jgi:hypothetical protein
MKLRLLLGLACLPAASFRGEKVSPGHAVPDLTFTNVVGGDGRTKLSEFRGQPVVIACYSTVFAGIEAARVAIDLEQKLAKDGLVVFLMEIKNHEETYLRALQMAELPGADSRLLRNQDLPVVYDRATGFPPYIVLIGVDATLRYAGSYQSANAMRKLLAAELEKSKKGWGDDPLVRKARALAHGAGRFGEARALLEPGSAGGHATAELRAAADEIEARFEALLRSLAHFVEQGEPRRAAAAASALAVAASGLPAWVERAAEAAARLESTEQTREAALEKKLIAILEPFERRGPKEGEDAPLRAFADKAEGTKVGARARRLANAVAYAVKELKAPSK